MTIQIPENDNADGVHEELIELSVASGDVHFQGIQVEPVHVVVVDDDAAGIALSPTQLALREHGGESSYQLSLTSEPTADLTVEMITGDQVTVNPSAVIFTPANWRTAQTVTVSAIDDAQVEAHGHVGLIRHVVASDDVAYNGITVSDVGAAIEDNDAVGLTSSGADGLAVSEGGEGISYDLKLSSRPAGDVTVALSGGGQLMVEPASLTFTSANWDAEQTVSVMALDDAIDEDDTHVGLVSYSLAGDPNYAGLPVLEQVVTIADDDMAGISLSVTALEVTRGGAGSYEVSLTSQPQAAVLVELRPSGGVRLDMPTCGDEQGACLFFNGENWDQPQAVTVRAPAAGQVTHGVFSGDKGYDSMVTPAVDVSLIAGGISVFLPLVNK